MSRTPEPRRRVTKKKSDPATWLARAEAPLEELVDRGAVVAVEGGDEEQRNGELGERLADEELPRTPSSRCTRWRAPEMIVTALISVARNDRHAAHHGCVAPGEEEVARSALLAAEHPADGDQAEKRDDENGVIGPGESTAGGRGHALGIMPHRR